MRPRRIFQAVNSSVISAHLISRAIDRKMILDDIAKEKFRELLVQQCAFSQIELVTFCLMGNHWHLCVSLDTAKHNPLHEASDDVFLNHLGLIYSETEVQKIGWQLESFRAGGFEQSAANLRQRYLDRMRDIPNFVKELKQRLSQLRRALLTWLRIILTASAAGSQPLAQPASRTQRPRLGGSLQECAGRRRRDRAAYHFCLHRPQSRPRGSCRGSQRLSLERLWRSGGGKQIRPSRFDPLGKDRVRRRFGNGHLGPGSSDLPLLAL